MSYSRYKMKQKFVNGIPTGEFTQGDLIQAGPFDTYDECQEGNASPSVTPDNPDMQYRWVASNEPWCEGTDEYKTEKQQQSADSGKSWTDSGATRKGEFVQSYSFACGFVAERWAEVNPNVDFICENGNKYYLQKKQISHDGVNWIDSGDTRKGPLIESQSDDCGYPQYRWVEIPLDIDYECVGDSKYYKEKEQVTNDGIVWQDTGRTRRGRGAEVHSADCGYVPPTTVTRWVVVEGEFVCQGVNKYQKQKEQISNDSGQTWQDTGNIRAGALIESDSYSCGYVSYRWVTVEGEFVCQGYDKYQKQNEEKTTDGKVWTPTGRTRTGALIEKNSYSCGYVSFRWVTVEGEFVCSGTDKYTKEKEQSSTDGKTWVDSGRERAGSLIERDSYSCGYVSYKWVEVPNTPWCDGYDLYTTEKQQYTTDGTNWQDVTPLNTRKGALVERNSTSCGYVPPTVITRWIDVQGEFICQGTDKYQKQKEQISEDEGQTWQDTGNVRAGSLIEAQSEDCGYVPPTPVQSDYLTFTALEDGRFKFTKSGLSYSTDGTTWKGLAANTNTPTIAAGSKIYFKGTKTPSTSSPRGIGHFSSTGRFTASGTPMSLLFGDNFEGQTSLSGKNYAFVSLFSGCTKLASIDGLVLPATTLANYCYDSMFNGCYNLTSIPSGLLPATTLADYCYYRMFWGCDGLTSIPSGLLPATTLAPYCYSYMFDNCNGLTSISTSLLPATTLADNCYEKMFQSCTGLTSIPSDLLPATSLASECYREMFSGCTHLTNVPNLPATTLARYCYLYMFSRCTELTEIPSDLLPATTLNYGCYGNMFQYCTNITTAPDLLAATLTTLCYNEMFKGCTKLNSIRMLATEISASQCLDSWVSNVSPTGTFYKAEGMTLPTGDSGIPSGWTVVEATRWVEDPSAYICQNYNKYHQENEEVTTDGQVWTPTGRTRAGALIETQSEDCGYVPSDYLTFTALEDGTFQFGHSELYYSLDKVVWTALAASTPTPTIAAGNKIYFKGELTTYQYWGVGTFSSTGRFTASGTPMSLLFGDNFEGQTSLSRKKYAFLGLFEDCTKLTSIDGLLLPATTLEEACYMKMFAGCTGLTSIPSGLLPATTLAGYRCYGYMFYNCTNITTAPDLLADTLTDGCYEEMFRGCSNLNSIRMLATNLSGTYSLSYWVYGVAASGTFYKKSGVTIPRGENGIPSGWTVVEV